MRSPRDPVVRRFIRRSTTVRIATLSPAGNPDFIPLYFVRFRGRIWMSTRSENPIVRDLKRNPEVVLLFHAERGPHHGWVLRVRGQARFRTEGSAVVPVYALSALRYILAPGGIWNATVHCRTLRVNLRYKGERSGEGGVIEIIPQTAKFLKPPS